MTQQRNRTAVYCRLSVDDGEDRESMSISNQREMLTRYCKENGFVIVDVYADDGYTGTNLDRPDFQRMKNDIENGMIDIVIAKDLSRIGREYLKTGDFIEIFLPEHDVRFIAVNDGVDSAKGDNDFMGFRNMINELYAKDISKKIRSARKTLAKQGKFTAPFAPYGYKKDPENKHRLLVDENTAPIVKRMFQLTTEGKTPTEIAEIFTAEKILIPRAYVATTYGIYLTGYDTRYPYDWMGNTVASILRSKLYIGTLVNHRRTSKSFKNKKIIQLPEDEWIEVENTHEAIIDRETWDIVQKMVAVKKRPNKNGVSQIFAGLVRCPDCGRALSYNIGTYKDFEGSFVCNYAKNKGKKYCTWHYITYKALYQTVLADIQRHAELLKKDRTKFEEALQAHTSSQNKKQLASLKKEQGKLQMRLEELGTITKKLYEDNALSRLSDDEYSRLSAQFSSERKETEERLSAIAEELRKEERDLENVARFTKIIAKYLDIKELNKTVLNELIDKIEVHEAEKIDGKRVQKVDIYYRFVGNLN